MYELNARKRRKFPIVKIILLSILTLGAFFLILNFLKLDKIAIQGPSSVVKLITNAGLKSDNGRTNVLLLGIGGDGHDGPNLTDTMIIASVDKNDGDVVLVNIPRDIWVTSINDKINAVYAYGQDKDGNGLAKTEEEVTKLFGIPIHYGLRMDFGGFVKAVDLVGGLDINVDNSFSDPMYPIEGKEDDTCGLKIEKQNINGQNQDVAIDATGSAMPISQINDFNNPFTCRYETLTFKKGLTHMDGATALKFVRSRHGNNGEGSDFARSARQQKVIIAFREKVISTKTLTDPKKIINLISTFGKSIDTDITSDDVPLFVKLGLKVDKSNVRRVIMDASNENSVLDVADPSSYGGAYALIPKNGDWQTLQAYLRNEIYNPPSPTPSPQNNQN